MVGSINRKLGDQASLGKKKKKLDPISKIIRGKEG
jgi:hypothetical protein